jgi:hypothetical protein
LPPWPASSASTRLWRVIHHYVDQARARMDAADVTEIAIDETAARRGHDDITLFVDIDQARVLFATEGRAADTVAAFADDLAAHGGDPEAIEEVCIDMSPAFIKGVDEHSRTSTTSPRPKRPMATSRSGTSGPPTARLEPVIDAAHTVKRHWDGILRWFDSKIANGLIEGINRGHQQSGAGRQVQGPRLQVHPKPQGDGLLLAGKLDVRLPT